MTNSSRELNPVKVLEASRDLMEHLVTKGLSPQEIIAVCHSTASTMSSIIATESMMVMVLNNITPRK